MSRHPIIFAALGLFMMLVTASYVAIAQPDSKGLGVKKSTEQATVGKTYALITGISKYQDSSTYHNLQYADKDAREFYKYMVSKTGGRLDPQNVDTLFNYGAGFMEFWKKFNRIKDKLQPNDEFYIYFSGHGDAYRADEAYLLAYDAPSGNDRNNYSTGIGLIDIHKLKVRIQEMTDNKINVILITDACRSNENPGKEEGKRMAFEKIFERKSGEIQLISCSSDQVSWEGPKWGGGRGLFSWHLINGLKGMADTSPEDGVVTLYELSRYVQDQVVADSRKEGKDFVQKPLFCCDNNDELVMAKVDAEEKKMLAASLRTKTSGYENGPSYASKGIGLGIMMKQVGEEDLYKEFMKAIKDGRLLEKDGAYDLLKKLLARPAITPALANELKFELSSKLMTDVGNVINTYLNAGQNNNNYTYTYFKTAANKLAVFKEIADTNYYSPLDVEVNRLFLEGHANWHSPKTKDLVECLAKVDSAVALKPQAAYLYNLKGLMHINLRQYAEAEKAFRKGIALAPNWLYPHHNLGFNFAEQRKYDSALYYYKLAVKLDTNYQTTYSGISNLYSARGMVDSAVWYAQKGLTKDPRDPGLWMQMGYYHNYMKKPELAYKEFHNAINSDSTYSYGYESLLRYFIYDKPNGDSSSYYVQKLVLLDRTNPVTYLSLGNIFAESKMFESAYQMYNVALSYDSLNPYIWRAAGKAYHDDGKDSTAISSYLRAIEIDSTDANTYNDLGNLYFFQEKYELSREAMAKALQYSPDDRVINSNYAYISTYLNDRASAYKYYLKALALDPKYDFVAWELARLYAQDKRIKEAIKYLEIAIKYGSYTKAVVSAEKDFDVLKTDPAFIKLIAKLK